MPNNNYRKGRDFEYRIVKQYKKLGYQSVFRSAGSHSDWDVVCLSPNTDTLVIQCKVTKSKSLADRMIKKFNLNPPMGVSTKHVQCLVVYVIPLRKVFETFV